MILNLTWGDSLRVGYGCPVALASRKNWACRDADELIGRWRPALIEVSVTASNHETIKSGINTPGQTEYEALHNMNPKAESRKTSCLEGLFEFDCFPYSESETQDEKYSLNICSNKNQEPFDMDANKVLHATIHVQI